MDKRSSVSSTHSNRLLQRESAIRAPVSEAYRDETIAQVQNSYNSRNHLPNRSKGLPLPVDPRALRAEKRSLLSETDSFISYLKCHAPSAENSTVHNVFHNLNEQFTKLVSLGQSETEETNNEHMNQICTIYNTFKDAYAQWCTQVNPNHDDVQPCDSISNVDTGTSEVSLTPPYILREQIKLELEKTKLDLAMRKAELEAREKLLALSNPASRVSQTSKQSVRHSLMAEQMRPLTQPLDNTTYAHIAQSPPGAASLEPIGLGLIHSMPVGVLGSQSNASVEAAQCPLPPTQSNLEQETRALAHNPSVSLQTPPTQAFQNYSPRRADIAQHRQTGLHSGPCQATDMFTHTPLGSEQSQRAHTFPQHSEQARSLGSNSEQLHYAPNSLPAATTRPQNLPLQQTHYTRPDQYSSTHQNQQQGGVTTYCTQQATTRTVNSGPATHAYPHHNFLTLISSVLITAIILRVAMHKSITYSWKKLGKSDIPVDASPLYFTITRFRSSYDAARISIATWIFLEPPAKKKPERLFQLWYHLCLAGVTTLKSKERWKHCAFAMGVAVFSPSLW